MSVACELSEDAPLWTRLKFLSRILTWCEDLCVYILLVFQHVGRNLPSKMLGPFIVTGTPRGHRSWLPGSPNKKVDMMDMT